MFTNYCNDSQFTKLDWGNTWTGVSTEYDIKDNKFPV